jgi:hypothetical protein
MTSRAELQPILAVTVIALGLAGCSADTNPVRDVFVATGVGAKPKPAPEFVVNSRSETVDYIPVGTSAPTRPIRGKTAAETKAAEAELDAARAAVEAKAVEARQVGATPALAPAPVPAQKASTAPLRGTN